VYDTTGYLIVYDYSTTPPTEAGRQKLNDDGTPVFPMTVKDKEGNVYQLTEETDENGNKTISSEYLGKQGTPLTADNFDADRIDSDKAIVSFEKGAGKYAFDKFDVKFSGSVRIRDKYSKIGDYNVPWKFLPEGGSDKIQAKIITVDNAINPADVMFQTPQGMLYEKKHLEGNTFEISAVAGVDNDVQQIYALCPTDNGKFLNLGRIDVVTYKPQTQKLVVVSVNGNTINTSELKSKLNEIYGEVGVTFEMETDTFTYTGTISFFEESSGWFSRYTTAMKAFNLSYRERIGANYDKDKNYLFILDGNASRSDRDAQGFMPLGGRFGYLFKNQIPTDQINAIAAHELGHGIWALKHTFDNDYGNIAVNTTNNLMDYTPGAAYLAKWQWEIIRYPALFTDPFGGDEEGMQKKMPNYFKQNIVNPIGRGELTHEDAIPILDENEHTVAYIIPDIEKTFIWINEDNFRGYFEEGKKSAKSSYLSYVTDKYERQENPISWGIYNAASDLGGFVFELIDSPIETSKNLATGLWKIVTLQFDIEKTWNRIINADLSDAAYVVSTVAFGYLAGPKGKKIISTDDVSRFQETLLEYSAKTAPRLSWTEVLALFEKARQFEIVISQHLKTIYTIENGYHVVRQVYFKVDGVMSIADDLIYNTNTGKFILNETKYGASNTLRKNQKVLQDAIKQGRKVEVRTTEELIINGKRIYKQGSEIEISEIIRSHSIDGTITNNTIQTLWTK
jgi:hypothetical protein